MLCSNMWKKQLKNLNKVYVYVRVYFNILFDSKNILNIEYVNINNEFCKYLIISTFY